MRVLEREEKVKGIVKREREITRSDDDKWVSG
jgi:hypothetical protein